MSNSQYTLYFQALSDIWTGTVSFVEKDGQIKEKIQNDRTINASLLGSIRWWFEVIVRGLGGYACDPSEKDNRCPNGNKKPTESGHHCVVCELFGCTDWARKFRFEIRDENNRIKTSQIKQNERFRFHFIPLRQIRDVEWSLLTATFRLIVEYGAIGGKTVFKPTNESNRATMLHHNDYGLLKFFEPVFINKSLSSLKKYVSWNGWRKPDHDSFAWASIQHFWSVNGKYVARQDYNNSTFNRIIGRPEPKNKSSCNDSWIAGYRSDPRNNTESESKKVFSFKDPARTFGFVQPIMVDYNTIKKHLTNVWGQSNWHFLTGDKILDQLFDGKEEHS